MANNNSNVNSFAENLATLTENTTKILSFAEAMNETVYGNESEVNVFDNMVLPSFSNVVKRLVRTEKTVETFTNGSGLVELNDGTYRKVKVSTVSRPPENISNLSTITKFGINPNWFFESLQYPRCVVRIDLADKIDAAADRVYVDRVILDSRSTVNGTTSMIDFYNTSIKNAELSYDALINLLTENSVTYREDKDEVKLPLTYEKYKGRFVINGTQLIKDINNVDRLWYEFDTLNYSQVDESGTELNNGNILSINDILRYENSLFKIVDINQQEKLVRLESTMGFHTLSTYDILDFYNDPFSEKIIEVGINLNEVDIIYVKAVDENYNLLSRNWSSPVPIYTNELVFDEDANITFEKYYNTSVADFGKTWIDSAKERQISAYSGKQPYAPILNVDDLKVVQINTQLDVTLDKERYNNLTTEISSTKSNITAVRNTISKNKDLLIQLSEQGERDNIQSIINSDTESLNSLTTQYTSLVEELNTLLTDSGAISYTPKYHIRGFFGIPQPRYTDETNMIGEQTIIGFEILYRYLHTDETGVKLDTYEYTSNNVVETGVFSDWNVLTSTFLTKIYNQNTDTYSWSTVNTQNGDEININQIDIPIRSGEKVEIKVRSISEAGYPYNPLKSSWSNSVIISFPDNLTQDDSVTTILETVKNDMTAVVLQETLSAAGVYSHISDSNSKFRHKSENLEYSEITTDGTQTTVTEMSLQDKISAMSAKIKELENNYTAMLDRMAAYDTKFTAEDSSISGLKSSLTALTTTVGTNTSNISSLTSSVATNTGNISSLTSSVSTLSSNVSSLTTSVGTNTSNISSLTTSVSANTSSIGILNTNMTSVTSNIATMQTSISDHETRIQALEQA